MVYVNKIQGSLVLKCTSISETHFTPVPLVKQCETLALPVYLVQGMKLP